MKIEGSHNINASFADRLGIHRFVKDLYSDQRTRSEVSRVRVYSQDNGEIHVETDVRNLSDEDYALIYGAQLKAHQLAREMGGDAPFNFKEFDEDDVSFRRLARSGEIYDFSKMPDPFGDENIQRLAQVAEQTEQVRGSSR